ncbi:hypothetical protein CY34DRAFT_812848 [Suillus luteus UH-Slu-Lm8-n1]|uniref:FAD-binding FR-type domain-containing protein n=1 Tax=Suillus luteus UH-Slu-Lm8-n1 TaxID=930992 RepID=A0A0D0A8R3_9AGAM|nr:hypothetical protein CY34DRAFT_812848 [Suillus luteus UH-Slu-Lm8-n1]
MASLNGWHKGERAIQEKLGFREAVSQSWTQIEGEMPEQYRNFDSKCLPFIPVTTLDSMAVVWDGNPLEANAEYHTHVGSQRKMFIAGIGVEFSTRRRNKFAGSVEAIGKQGCLLDICTTVNEAFGNCPKYITILILVPFPHTKPRVAHQEINVPPTGSLPSDLIAFILSSDTVFLGSSYLASEEDAPRFPSHVGMNHRGGRPGFVRVRSDGRTLVLPDYSAIMPSQNALTTIEITGYIFIEDALPVRQQEYSPPVKLLKEEQASSTYFSTEDAMHVTLSRIRLHSSNFATFTFESPNRLNIIPGQAAILDFTSFLGASPYRHMAPESPNLARRSLTMRLKPGGAVTGALFNIANKLSAVCPELLEDSRPLGLSVTLLGIAGDFGLEPLDPHEGTRIVETGEAEQMSVQRKVTMKLLWIAGRIGITPFLAMLIPSYSAEYEITLLLSSREPDVILSLLSGAIEAAAHKVNLVVHVFSHTEQFESSLPTSVSLHRHSGRMTSSIISDFKADCVYVCGPELFEREVIQGVDGMVRREGFAY